ncbi:ribonucleoside reductase [Escherichia coli]|uniref:Ribonucleoside reductase n=1 Tax=Escherichia coli TaxID=562 RepID=A0A854BPT1_ECOLX|nr:ribonucleoside reductase [Escherichia coli]OKV14807.1 ribonucleoside reductase [Escherichia coli]OKV22444.1 ribonucleoside reductase [Escherichia coli]OKV51547.1 ribonucleoside reductase [Escherichia coli]OKW03332.1 ribonucleoside reductase [Escherichia coli]
MALKKYSTPSTFHAFAASGNAGRMRRERLIRPTVLLLHRPRRIRQNRINSVYSPSPRHLSQKAA